jgi:hypothetical protein
MQNWEYKVVTVEAKRSIRFGSYDSNIIEQELNRYGQEAWELAAAEVVSYPRVPPTLIFKRAL